MKHTNLQKFVKFIFYIPILIKEVYTIYTNVHIGKRKGNMHKIIANKINTFHIQGGGARQYSLGLSVSTGYDFFVSCFNTTTQNISKEQPVHAPHAGAVFFCVCEAVQGRKYVCNL
jgi:hypothetical protein